MTGVDLLAVLFGVCFGGYRCLMLSHRRVERHDHSSSGSSARARCSPRRWPPRSERHQSHANVAPAASSARNTGSATIAPYRS